MEEESKIIDKID